MNERLMWVWYAERRKQCVSGRFELQPFAGAIINLVG